MCKDLQRYSRDPILSCIFNSPCPAVPRAPLFCPYPTLMYCIFFPTYLYLSIKSQNFSLPNIFFCLMLSVIYSSVQYKRCRCPYGSRVGARRRKEEIGLTMKLNPKRALNQIRKQQSRSRYGARNSQIHNTRCMYKKKSLVWPERREQAGRRGHASRSWSVLLFARPHTGSSTGSRDDDHPRPWGTRRRWTVGAAWASRATSRNDAGGDDGGALGPPSRMSLGTSAQTWRQRRESTLVPAAARAEPRRTRISCNSSSDRPLILFSLGSGIGGGQRHP